MLCLMLLARTLSLAFLRLAPNVRLDAWLAGAFESQLLLANHWLRERHERKRSRVKAEGDRDWKDLYHGSCLDITNYIHPERNIALSVLQTKPFTLTDGQSYIVAHLTPGCAQDFAIRYPAWSYLRPNCVIAVRKYTIRYTPYGPPRTRLHFILHRVDWLRADCPYRYTHHVNSGSLAAVYQRPQVGVLLQRLFDARAREDNRSLARDGEIEIEDTMVGASDESHAPDGDTSTQVAFGTQIQHPIRTAPDTDEPQAIGVTRLEPVLAEKTQRADIQPGAANTTYEKGQQLLSLMDRLQKPSKTSNEKAAEQTQAKDIEDKHEISEEAATSAPECPWMKGFIFNSETLKVPKLQQECLRREMSWLKPQPGVPPFQHGNMPQTILQTFHRIADEQATLREEGNSDDDSDIDPSSDSLPENITLSADSVPQTTPDDDSSSSQQISWPASPEPPRAPANIRQELPPDSSLETPTSSAERHPTTHSTSRDTPSQQPNVIEVSDNDAEPDPSPPAIQAPADSDDDMEMDESVPQALGEDLTEKPHSYEQNSSTPSPKRFKKQSIVQVTETPYGTGKAAQHIAGAAPTDTLVSKQGQDSSAESKHTSSTSIVHSTYDLPAASSSAAIEQCHLKKTDKQDVVSEERMANIQHENVDMHNASTESRHNHAPEDVPMTDQPLDTEESVEATLMEDRPRVPAIPAEKKAPSVTSSTSPKAVRLPLREISSETSPTMLHAIKRKLDASPVKGNRRNSKRREIKIVDFGDATPASFDPIVKLNEEREESLRRFRKERDSSRSFECQPEPTSKSTERADTEDVELDLVNMPCNKVSLVNRSPHHQSLYDEPSPRPTAASRPQLPPADTQPKRQSQLLQVQDGSVQNAQTRSAPVVSNEDTHMTVFQSFKASYPEYKGDTKHFHNQCKQMYSLDLEDKMVPKWQWDDFIIRNRTDYRDYAMECLDRGENAEPYYRFYKDKIRDTLYRRGLIESRRTLQQALEEVGILVQDATATTTTTNITTPPRNRNHATSRKSLSGSFHQSRKPTQDRIVASSSCTQPRHSLPTTTNSHSRHLPNTPSTRQEQFQQHQQQQEESKALYSTGDPFRDYFFAIQRSPS